VRRLFGWVAGLVGIAAAARYLARRSRAATPPPAPAPTQADPAITLSIGLPNFPSYPSNHASLSGGMARILGSFFPAEKNRLDGLADQAAMSRLFGGIHFRVDNDTGLRLGRTVARWALCQQPADGSGLRRVDGCR